jgi:phosphoribosylaminoimidazole-succinocarboxamide synthase
VSAPVAKLHAQGKVRDVYDVGDAMLLVATDRISAFDVVLPEPIPDKGRVLTGLTRYWLDRTKDLVPNHLLSPDVRDFPAPFRDEPSLAGRAMLVKKAQVVLVECVARGYLTGSGLKQYRAEGHVCGVPLPPGLVEASKLP